MLEVGLDQASLEHRSDVVDLLVHPGQPLDEPVPTGKWSYRAGATSALLLGAAYIIIIPVYAHAGAPPNGGEAWLNYLVGKTTVWWAILGLSVLTDLLFVPVALSLYLALRAVNRDAMLLAAAFVGLFVVLDLAGTWSRYASLITFSVTVIIASVLTTVWILLVGYGLYRLGQK